MQELALMLDKLDLSPESIDSTLIESKKGANNQSITGTNCGLNFWEVRFGITCSP